MTTATVARIVRQKPLLGQLDLRCIHDAASRILLGHELAARLDRRLSRAELQIMALCGAVCEIVVGEFGEDGEGEPVGDLTLKAQPQLPAAHQYELDNRNGRRYASSMRVKCSVCGEMYEPLQPYSQKYCGSACKAKAFRRRRKEQGDGRKHPKTG